MAENPILTERKRLRLTQKQMADKLHCSQRTVTALESESADQGSGEFRRYLELARRLMPDDRAYESKFYSWDADVFEILQRKRQLPNRADKVSVDVKLSIAKKNDRFVSHGMSITYNNLFTEDTPEGLLIDAVSHQDAELKVTVAEPVESSDERVVVDGSFEFRRLVSQAKHVACYQLRGVEPVRCPQIKIQYEAELAAEVGDVPDAMGFAVPADLLLGSIEIEVEFCGVVPVPHASARPFLIRRYARVARPERFTSDDIPSPQMLMQEAGRSLYRLELARPKPGYGYVISWAGLKKLGTGE